MCLIIFTRYPEAGKVKTRLIPTLGEKGAELLHREMVEHTIGRITPFKVKVEVHFAGGSHVLMKSWLGNQLRYQEQQGTCLGERMYNAAAGAFAENNKKVVLIGTDCPDITTNHVEQAFNLLDSSDLVLGPAYDGGYYLVGFKKLVNELFHGITWGSNHVYRQTIKAAEQANMKTAALEKLTDVDCPADLPFFAAAKSNFSV